MATQATTSGLEFSPRLSKDRGHADHGWLKTYHTFSFASYQDFDFQQWGPLRVINEDRVDKGTGFGEHSHREFEIYSYVVSGTLEHRDSMKNLEVLKRGDVQMTSAGTGIKHAEWNKDGQETTHFLQIWALPNKARLAPKYYTRHFSEDEKRGKLVKIAAPVEDEDVKDEREALGPAPVHSDLSTYASLLPASQKLTHSLSPKARKGYLHLIMKSGYRAPSRSAPSDAAKLRLTALGEGGKSLEVEEGDGVFVEVKGQDAEKKIEIENVGGKEAEFLWFEMNS